MNTKKIPPFPAKGQDIKFKSLDRNALIVLWVCIIVAVATVLILAASANAQFVNLSTRGYIGNNTDQVLIAGFNLKATTKIVIRGVSPPINGKIKDPVLELRNSSGGLVAMNDNQGASSLPTTNPKDAVLEKTLGAGSWTAVVRGKNEKGIALVEVFNMDLLKPATPTPSPTRSPTPTVTPTPSITPTAAPVVFRDYKIAWAYAGDPTSIEARNHGGIANKFHVFYQCTSQSKNFYVGDVREALLSKMKIGDECDFKVIAVYPDGFEGKAPLTMFHKRID